jgi:predicted DNA-binding transcriptional regulator AlpA
MITAADLLENFMCGDDAAAYLGVARSTLAHWHVDGLPAPPRVEVGRRLFLYPKAELIAWKAARDEALASSTDGRTRRHLRPAAPAMPAVRVRTRAAPSNPPEAIT